MAYYFIRENEAYRSYILGMAYIFVVFAFLCLYILYTYNLSAEFERALTLSSGVFATSGFLIQILSWFYPQKLYLLLSNKRKIWIVQNTISEEKIMEWREESDDWKDL